MTQEIIKHHIHVAVCTNRPTNVGEARALIGAFFALDSRGQSHSLSDAAGGSNALTWFSITTGKQFGGSRFRDNNSIFHLWSGLIFFVLLLSVTKCICV